jgi:hypothetical protein
MQWTLSVILYTKVALVRTNTLKRLDIHFINWMHYQLMCLNPSLGLMTKARACKGAGREWSPEATFHDPERLRVWESGRIEPPHPQVNFITLGVKVLIDFWLSESDCRGQNPSNLGVPYNIGKLLEHRCLKWARMTHLNIWNTSYAQKKGQESNCQTWILTIKSKKSPWFPCV